jgi:hypothetical protein
VEIKSVGLPSDSIDEIKPMKPLGKSAVTIKEEKAQAPIVKRSTLTEPADTLGSKIEEINAEIGKIEAQVYVKLLGANYALEDSAGVRISDIAFAIGNDTVSLAALALQRERFVQITEENCAWMKGNRKLLDKVSAIADRLNALLPRAPRLDYRVYYVTGKWNSVVGG